VCVGPGLAGALFFEVVDVREETMRADRHVVIAEVNDTRFSVGSAYYLDGVKVQCTMLFSEGRWGVETVHKAWTLAGGEPYRVDVEKAKDQACLIALVRSEAELANECREMQRRNEIAFLNWLSREAVQANAGKIEELEEKETMSDSERGDGVEWERVEKYIADYKGWELTVELEEKNGWKWTAQWHGDGGRETRTASWYAATRQKAQEAAVAAVDLRNR